jgi:hypothetical protein
LIWITGIVLLLSYTRTNPIDAGRSLISQLGSRPAQVPVVVDEYDLTCSRLPHAAQELRRLDERWGKISLEMSVAHQGSGIRMRRALRRLVNGEPFVSGDDTELQRRGCSERCSDCRSSAPSEAPSLLATVSTLPWVCATHRILRPSCKRRIRMSQS